MVLEAAPRRASRLALGLSALAFLALAFLVVIVAPGVATATVARGIADPTLTQPGSRLDPVIQDGALAEIGPKLKATYVRFVVSWAAAEPGLSVYDEAYLAGVDHAITSARTNGLKVIVTFAYVPIWASNSAFWYQNPYPNKGYDPRYAMKTDQRTMSAFQAFCRRIATKFKGRVFGYEAWNEPNLHLTLYPQSTKTDKDYGAHVYIKMLRRFSAGIHTGDPRALRIAGGTAPRGYKASAPLASRQKMTSPQRFARSIKAAAVGSLFEAYSHHPYTPGASANNWPEAAPRDPTTTVNLKNLGTLLQLFPSKPFYLTEYGYQTAPCYSFTQQFVSLETQADYLRRAYAYAGRYRQVKMLMWFLLDDYSPSGQPTDLQGFYTGLRDVGGNKKPAWYAFAGGTHLTVQADAASITAGSTVSLTGTLSSEADGVLAGKSLVVQSHTEGQPWSTLTPALTPVVTGELGDYTVNDTPSASTYYRLVWPGVVTSPVCYVAVE